MFIAFEGIDGSGKSTLSNFVARSLRSRGKNVLHTRPESHDTEQRIIGSPIMTAIKTITHNPKFAADMATSTELLLYFAQIAQLTNQIVLPALKSKKIVIADRYLHSLYAYFHYGKGVSWSVLKSLANIATGGLRPDLVILTDIPAVQAFNGKRNANKPLGRKELLGVKFFEFIRQGFITIAKHNKTTWQILDSAKLTKQKKQQLVVNLIHSNLI